MSLRSAVLLVVLAASTPGCSRRDTVAVDPALAWCGWSGSAVLADGRCTGALAQRVFARAVCACDVLSLTSDLVTDGFDARSGPWLRPGGGAGGDVGAVGGLTAAGLLQVGGSLAVSGGGVSAGPTLRVAGDLDAGGALGRPASTVSVGGSARIAGNVAVASLTFTGSGTLTTPAGASVTGYPGAAVVGDVTVAPACPCDAAQAIDVAAIVPEYVTTNDNGAFGLAADALAAVSGTQILPLPCGRFYLDRIQGAGELILRVTGRTALFVAGGITLSGSLTIELAPLAELDLFVDGSVNLPGVVVLGDPARPTALRIWASAGGAITVPSGAQWAATLYAPHADLAIGAPLDLFGAVLVRHLVNDAPVSVHYDRSVASAADACGR